MFNMTTPTHSETSVTTKETHESGNEARSRGRRFASAVALTAVAGGAGAIGGAYVTNRNSVSEEQVTAIVRTETSARGDASSVAEQISAAIQRGNERNDVTEASPATLILLGKVSIDGRPLPFQDPILLTSRPRSGQTFEESAEERPMFLGIARGDATGKVIVTPVEFNPTTMHFEAEDPQQEILKATVAGSVSNDGLAVLRAIDRDDKTVMTHFDGHTPLTPGDSAS
jgi:hypothetical protein